MTCEQGYDFTADYECSALPAIKALERDVLGSDYGGTSWTTKQQADDALAALDLTPNSRLLEVGSGAGWPSLYLSDRSGCDATLLDMPFIALEHAAQRAAADGIDGQVMLVNGSGVALHFADASFDRLSHSDVLCCLPEKLEMLCECRRVATDDARMHFIVIRPAHGLSEDDHKHALKVGPPFVDVPGGYRPLLDASGWKVLQQIDITQEFGDTIEKLVAGLRANTPVLQEAYGADELRESWLSNEVQLDMVRANKLQRFIYIASPA